MLSDKELEQMYTMSQQTLPFVENEKLREELSEAVEQRQIGIILCRWNMVKIVILVPGVKKNTINALIKRLKEKYHLGTEFEVNDETWGLYLPEITISTVDMT